MFDLFPTKIFPPALLGGITLYGLITMLWLQPLVEGRMAELKYIPQCEASLQKAEASTPPPDNPRRRELEMVLRMYEGTGLSQLPYVREIIEMARQELTRLQSKQFRTSSIDRTSLCACAVDTVFENNHLRMTLHVASLRTHVPKALKSMNRSVMAIAASGQCGKLPFMKG